MPLRPREQAYWERYLLSLTGSERPKDPSVTAGYAGNSETTDGLLQLYLSGKKSAGSSLLEDFIAANDPLPKVGNYWICLDGMDEPRCILKTEKIVTHKFRDVPIEVAIAEGEGDLSLEYWRKVHEEFYRPHLAAWNVTDLDSATVITEFFRIVHR